MNGESPADLHTPVTFTTPATATSDTGSYAITPGGATASNYAITFVAGTLTIEKAGTAATVVSSSNPSLPGEAVAFTFTVGAVAPGAGTPAGTVQFTINGEAAGSVALVNGAATLVTATLTVGTHVVAAVYGGNLNFHGIGASRTPAQLINTPPVAAPDTIERYPTNGTKVSIAMLLSNDVDADGDTLEFISVDTTSGMGGTIWRSGNWIFYSPPAGHTGADWFNYTISDGRGTPVTGLVTVNIKVDSGFSQNLTITDLGDGAFGLHFDGIPGWTYVIQFTESLESPVWQMLVTVTANAQGVYEHVDTPPPGAPQRFYRSVWIP